MTLIVSLASDDFVAHLTDRRLSQPNVVVDDNAPKTTIVVMQDARTVLSFTGLARAKRFDTHEWINDRMKDSLRRDTHLHPCLEAFRQYMQDDLDNHPDLRGVRRSDRRLTIVIDGFKYVQRGTVCFRAVLSNHYDSKKRQYDDQFDEIRLDYYEKHPLAVDVLPLGSLMGWRRSDELSIKELFSSGNVASAVQGRTMKLIAEIADRPKSMNRIGKRISSTRLVKDPLVPPFFSYASPDPEARYMAPSFVFVGDQGVVVASGISLFVQDNAGNNVPNVPKVHPSAPCRCGSGLAFKECAHGKRQGSVMLDVNLLPGQGILPEHIDLSEKSDPDLPKWSETNLILDSKGKRLKP